MPLDARVEAWVRLSLASVRPSLLSAALSRLGSAEAVLAATPQALAAVSTEIAAALKVPPDPDYLARALRWLEAPGHQLIAWDDIDFPKLLLEAGEPPPVLYYIGDRSLLNRPTLAIVGSRNATPQGRENARDFATALAGAGLTIVSGLALGIDGAAHEGALLGRGSTLAVVATGLDRVYPAEHRELAHAIARKGGLVSEFLPGTPPLRANFPQRNRLISGISLGVLVVEASLSSGSLITARHAADQNRDMFAIPGSIHSPFSRGPHKLIRDGAKLVETAQDVLDELRVPGLVLAEVPQRARGATGELPHAAVLDALGQDPTDLDRLVQRSQLPPEALAAALVELELDGLVTSLPGARWQRIA